MGPRKAYCRCGEIFEYEKIPVNGLKCPTCRKRVEVDSAEAIPSFQKKGTIGPTERHDPSRRRLAKAFGTTAALIIVIAGITYWAIPSQRNEPTSRATVANDSVQKRKAPGGEAVRKEKGEISFMSLFPRPIQNERDVTTCMNRIREEINKGESYQRYNNCVILYLGPSWYEYFPDGEYSRCWSEGRMLVYSMNNSETPFTISVYDASIDIQINDLELKLDMYIDGPCSRLGDWGRISDPDDLEAFCLKLYHRFQERQSVVKHILRNRD